MKKIFMRALEWAQTTTGDYIISFGIFIFGAVMVHVILFWVL